MESLLMSIALRYGKGKLTEMGLNYAAKLLGIDQQEQNPKYTFGMPFTNQSINPINMLKRSALNTGVKSLFSGSALAPLTLGAGAIYFLNKNRKKLTGYDTQAAYEDARKERIANKRLDKITDRIIAGKNYGNYEEALLDSNAGAVEIDGIIDHGANFGFETESEKKAKGGVGTASYGQTFHHSDNNNTDSNDNSSSNDNSGSNNNSGSKDTSKGGLGSAGFGGMFHARRGGIASL